MEIEHMNTPPRTTTILLADDHRLMREAVRNILENQGNFECVAECGSGIEAILAAREYKPDVAIVDIGMEPVNGLEATPEILKASPRTVVLILTMRCDHWYVDRAIKLGARGYVLKTSAVAELIHAVREVRDGRTYFPHGTGECKRE
jgi:DNA-binding NarL/FixJ family response regulator